MAASHVAAGRGDAPPPPDERDRETRQLRDALKPFFPAVVTLVLGIVLGTWQPRGELLAMRAEMDELRAAAARPCRGDAARSIRSILRAETPDLSREETPPPGPASAADGAAPAADVEDEPDGPASAPPGRSAEALRDGMRTALDARRAQALAALAEQGDLDDAEIDAVEAAMDQMNRELKAEVDAFVEAALETGEVDRRDVMDFAAESLDIVIAADERMRQALPAVVYDTVNDSAVDPFSYIAGDTLDGLVRLEGVAAPMLEGR